MKLSSWLGDLWSRLGQILTFGPEDVQPEAGVIFVTANWDIRKHLPFTLEWDGHEGSVSITLLSHAEKQLKTVWEVTSDNLESTVVFRAPHFLESGETYSFEILDSVGHAAVSPRWVLDARQLSNSTSDLPPPASGNPPDPTRPPPTTTSTIPKSTSTRAPTASTSPPAPEPSPGLSSGAYAGIGVGATLAGILIVGLIAWAIRHAYRRGQDSERRAAASAPAHQTTYPPTYPPAYPQTESGTLGSSQYASTVGQADQRFSPSIPSWSAHVHPVNVQANPAMAELDHASRDGRAFAELPAKP